MIDVAVYWLETSFGTAGISEETSGLASRFTKELSASEYVKHVHYTTDGDTLSFAITSVSEDPLETVFDHAITSLRTAIENLGYQSDLHHMNIVEVTDDESASELTEKVTA